MPQRLFNGVSYEVPEEMTDVEFRVGAIRHQNLQDQFDQATLASWEDEASRYKQVHNTWGPEAGWARPVTETVKAMTRGLGSFTTGLATSYFGTNLALMNIIPLQERKLVRSAEEAVQRAQLPDLLKEQGVELQTVEAPRQTESFLDTASSWLASLQDRALQAQIDSVNTKSYGERLLDKVQGKESVPPLSETLAGLKQKEQDLTQFMQIDPMLTPLKAVAEVQKKFDPIEAQRQGYGWAPAPGWEPGTISQYLSGERSPKAILPQVTELFGQVGAIAAMSAVDPLAGLYAAYSMGAGGGFNADLEAAQGDYSEAALRSTLVGIATMPMQFISANFAFKGNPSLRLIGAEALLRSDKITQLAKLQLADTIQTLAAQGERGFVKGTIQSAMLEAVNGGIYATMQAAIGEGRTVSLDEFATAAVMNAIVGTTAHNARMIHDKIKTGRLVEAAKAIEAAGKTTEEARTIVHELLVDGPPSPELVLDVLAKHGIANLEDTSLLTPDLVGKDSTERGKSFEASDPVLYTALKTTSEPGLLDKLLAGKDEKGNPITAYDFYSRILQGAEDGNFQKFGFSKQEEKVLRTRTLNSIFWRSKNTFFGDKEVLPYDKAMPIYKALLGAGRTEADHVRAGAGVEAANFIIYNLAKQAGFDSVTEFVNTEQGQIAFENVTREQLVLDRYGVEAFKQAVEGKWTQWALGLYKSGQDLKQIKLAMDTAHPGTVAHELMHFTIDHIKEGSEVDGLVTEYVNRKHGTKLKSISELSVFDNRMQKAGMTDKQKHALSSTIHEGLVEDLLASGMEGVEITEALLPIRQHLEQAQRGMVQAQKSGVVFSPTGEVAIQEMNRLLWGGSKFSNQIAHRFVVDDAAKGDTVSFTLRTEAAPTAKAGEATTQVEGTTVRMSKQLHKLYTLVDDLALHDRLSENLVTQTEKMQAGRKRAAIIDEAGKELQLQKPGDKKGKQAQREQIVKAAQKLREDMQATIAAHQAGAMGQDVRLILDPGIRTGTRSDIFASTWAEKGPGVFGLNPEEWHWLNPSTYGKQSLYGIFVPKKKVLDYGRTKQAILNAASRLTPEAYEKLSPLTKMAITGAQKNRGLSLDASGKGIEELGVKAVFSYELDYSSPIFKREKSTLVADPVRWSKAVERFKQIAPESVYHEPLFHAGKLNWYFFDPNRANTGAGGDRIGFFHTADWRNVEGYHRMTGAEKDTGIRTHFLDIRKPFYIDDIRKQFPEFTDEKTTRVFSQKKLDAFLARIDSDALSSQIDMIIKRVSETKPDSPEAFREAFVSLMEKELPRYQQETVRFMFESAFTDEVTAKQKIDPRLEAAIKAGGNWSKHNIGPVPYYRTWAMDTLEAQIAKVYEMAGKPFGHRYVKALYNGFENPLAFIEALGFDSLIHESNKNEYIALYPEQVYLVDGDNIKNYQSTTNTQNKRAQTRAHRRGISPELYNRWNMPADITAQEQGAYPGEHMSFFSGTLDKLKAMVARTRLPISHTQQAAVEQQIASSKQQLATAQTEAERVQLRQRITELEQQNTDLTTQLNIQQERHTKEQRVPMLTAEYNRAKQMLAAATQQKNALTDAIRIKAQQGDDIEISKLQRELAEVSKKEQRAKKAVWEAEYKLDSLKKEEAAPKQERKPKQEKAPGEKRQKNKTRDEKYIPGTSINLKLIGPLWSEADPLMRKPRNYGDLDEMKSEELEQVARELAATWSTNKKAMEEILHFTPDETTRGLSRVERLAGNIYMQRQLAAVHEITKQRPGETLEEYTAREPERAKLWKQYQQNIEVWMSDHNRFAGKQLQDLQILMPSELLGFAKVIEERTGKNIDSLMLMSLSPTDLEKLSFVVNKKTSEAFQKLPPAITELQKRVMDQVAAILGLPLTKQENIDKLSKAINNAIHVYNNNSFVRDYVTAFTYTNYLSGLRNRATDIMSEGATTAYQWMLLKGEVIPRATYRLLTGDFKGAGRAIGDELRNPFTAMKTTGQHFWKGTTTAFNIINGNIDWQTYTKNWDIHTASQAYALSILAEHGNFTERQVAKLLSIPTRLVIASDAFVREQAIGAYKDRAQRLLERRRADFGNDPAKMRAYLTELYEERLANLPEHLRKRWEEEKDKMLNEFMQDPTHLVQSIADGFGAECVAQAAPDFVLQKILEVRGWVEKQSDIVTDFASEKVMLPLIKRMNGFVPYSGNLFLPVYWAAKVPYVRMLTGLLFTTTKYNLTKLVLQSAPTAYMTYGLGGYGAVLSAATYLASGSHTVHPNKEGSHFNKANFKRYLMSQAVGHMLVLAVQGLINKQRFLPPPEDQKEWEERRMKGMPFVGYRFGLGDEWDWHTFPEPFNSLFSMIGTTIQMCAARAEDLDPAELTARRNYLMSSLATQFYNTTFAGDIADAVKPEAMLRDMPQKTLRGLIPMNGLFKDLAYFKSLITEHKGPPVPNYKSDSIAVAIAGELNTYVPFDINSVFNQFIPGFEKEVPESFDYFGRTVTRRDLKVLPFNLGSLPFPLIPWRWSQGYAPLTAVDAEASRLGYYFSMPSDHLYYAPIQGKDEIKWFLDDHPELKEIPGLKGVVLTPQQQRDFTIRFGERIMELMPKLLNNPEYQKAEKGKQGIDFSAVVVAAKERAKVDLIKYWAPRGLLLQKP